MMCVGVSAHQKLELLSSLVRLCGYESVAVFGDCFDEVVLLDPVQYPGGALHPCPCSSYLESLPPTGGKGLCRREGGHNARAVLPQRSRRSRGKCAGTTCLTSGGCTSSSRTRGWRWT